MRIRSALLSIAILLVLGCGDPAPATDGGLGGDAGDGGHDGMDAGHDAGPIDCEDGDGDGVDDSACGGTDCDDADATRYPGAIEVCDGGDVDEDCDPATHGALDRDFDGHDDAACRNVIDGEATSAGTDCDDARAAVRVGAVEACNGLDDDCDGAVDETVQVSGFADEDRDGHGDPARAIRACAGSVGLALDDLDCDDADPHRHGRMAELCDAADNDCDGEVDESTQSVPWYADVDADTFGSARSVAMTSCTPIAGRSILAIDCDDMRATRSPAADEVCDALDNDCDDIANFVIGVNDWEDDDGDGVPDAACASDPATADCDDRDPAVHPDAPERCNRRDDDCDGTVDERCAVVVPTDGGMGDAGAACTADLSSDPSHCGECGRRCGAPVETTATCTGGVCGYACPEDRLDCDRLAGNGCEIDPSLDRFHCGRCGEACLATETCVAGECVRAALGSTGAEGALEVRAGETRVLSAGRHDFTTITVAAGGTLAVDGDGTLDLRATDDVLVAGTIDLDGGNGGTAVAGNGGGGDTGTGRAGAAGAAVATTCALPGGGPGAAGSDGLPVGSCGLGGNGGGAGGQLPHGGGGGGGGWAGGGGGSSVSGGGGGAGGSFGGGTGGAGGMPAATMTGGSGGQAALGPPYAGANGIAQGAVGAGAGGGGSIGAAAAADLPVATTFYPGSGGGGAAAGSSASAFASGGGGGGGGGALRIVSATRITITATGVITASGGDGGSAGGFSGGGGGGSGGVIVMIAPEVRASSGSVVRAQGGLAVRGGGGGGLGRIRLSVDPARCQLVGTMSPPPVAGCAPLAATPGRAYVARYPD